MKTFIITVTLMVFLASVPFAFARGNQRWTINKKWNQVQAWQKSQDRMFSKIERDAARELRSLKGGAATTYSPARIIYPPCGR
jgi:hypothetical protein